MLMNKRKTKPGKTDFMLELNEKLRKRVLAKYKKR